MKEELEKLLKAERKHARQLAELRKARQKLMQLKVPDQKVLAMIDAEIAERLKG